MMSRILRPPLLAAGWLALCIAGAAPCKGAHLPFPDAAVKAYLDEFANVGPINGVVLVGQQRRVVAAGAYGKANFAYDTPNALDTRFEIASITKTFTAQLVMKLVDEGKVQLSSTIRTYLPGFPAEWADRVTIEQLLTHTSGVQGDIADFPTAGHNFPAVVAQINADLFSLDELLKLVAERPLLFPAGSAYSYSSDGYTILGAVAASVCVQSYRQALQNRILNPLRLEHTDYVPQTTVVRRLASGYRETWDGYENAPRMGISPAGGLCSTAADLFRWTEAVRSGAVMSAQSKKRAWILSPNVTQYGWKRRVDETAPQKESLLIQCSGALPGANCLVTLTLADGITVIALTNTRQITFRLDELTDGVIAILRGRDVAPVKRSAARALRDQIAASGEDAALKAAASAEGLAQRGFYVSEPEINSLGYYYLQRGTPSIALAVLRLNATLFPTSWNAHDSLAEGYAAIGARDKAIEHYRKSLDLNRKNDNARAQLKRLKP